MSASTFSIGISSISFIASVVLGFVAIRISRESDKKMAKILASQLEEKSVVVAVYTTQLPRQLSMSEIIEQTKGNIADASYLFKSPPRKGKLSEIWSEFYTKSQTFIQTAQKVAKLK